MANDPTRSPSGDAGTGKRWSVSDLVPAAVFHASEFAADEAIARGWTLAELARRAAKSPDDVQITQASLEFYAIQDEGIRMGRDGAEGFARAFGSSPDVWLNLEKAWLDNPQARGTPDPVAWKFYGMDDEVSVAGSTAEREP